MEISKQEYDRLVESQEILNALEAAGVNNWEGYELAIESISGPIR